jgi:hypothetical protein
VTTEVLVVDDESGIVALVAITSPKPVSVSTAANGQTRRGSLVRTTVWWCST